MNSNRLGFVKQDFQLKVRLMNTIRNVATAATLIWSTVLAAIAGTLTVDVNRNNKMDMNFISIPKEQYGFSNDASGNFGPPSFAEASFTVSGDMALEINL
jgi:uncharacterized protein (DUF2141 family)